MYRLFSHQMLNAERYLRKVNGGLHARNRSIPGSRVLRYSLQLPRSDQTNLIRKANIETHVPLMSHSHNVLAGYLDGPS